MVLLGIDIGQISKDAEAKVTRELETEERSRTIIECRLSSLERRLKFLESLYVGIVTASPPTDHDTGAAVSPAPQPKE